MAVDNFLGICIVFSFHFIFSVEQESQENTPEKTVAAAVLVPAAQLLQEGLDKIARQHQQQQHVVQQQQHVVLDNGMQNLSLESQNK